MFRGKFLTHFGVYGVCVINEKLLCIEKNAGPYSGRYDLPGGSQEQGESLIDTLKREFLEETGFIIKGISDNQIFDAFVREKGKDFVVHHIFSLYNVTKSEEASQELPDYVADGQNDSNGIQWVEIDKLNINNASPLILKFVDRYKGRKGILESNFYDNWEAVDWDENLLFEANKSG